MTSKYVKVDDYTDIHYIEKGEGETILFIPGLTFSYKVFLNQINFFSKDYKVIAIDPRSQGLSTKTSFGNNYTIHGRDLNAIIKKLELKDMVLVGWSTGNLCIWSYLKQFGYDNVRKVVTIDMSPNQLSFSKDDWKEGDLEELRYVADEFLNSASGTREFFKEYLKTVMLEKSPSKDEIEFFIDISSKTPYHICRELFLDAIFKDYRETLKESAEKVPTLMFIAKHWSEVADKYMKNNFPKTKTHIMGGHLMFYEKADEWNKVFKEFLENN